ncbi:creatininase family protein [Dongia sp.]|uniref:creatininase family protein n=1 Tax=Dongia sp. TaxID=1977262 RepID=UPI0035B1C671
MMGRQRVLLASFALAGLLLLGSVALAAPTSVELEQLTSPEVRDLLAEGYTTIIIPTGGTEQNGPQLVLGKHNIIVRYTSAEIARRLGSTLVAPVIAYVPEGEIDPPQGHMRYPGTISLPEPIFGAVLESAARSFIAEGFKTVLLIGDSGGNQAMQADTAARLDAEFAPKGVHVFAVDAYYAANGQVEWLAQAGETEADIGTHAGIRETSELLAIAPDTVRSDMLAPGTDWAGLGASGRPDHASAERGRALLELKIDAALRQIRQLMAITP